MLSHALLDRLAVNKSMIDIWHERVPNRALQEDGVAITANNQFKKDAANVVVGVIWHTSLTAAPIFMVIKAWEPFVVSLSVIALCTAWLKIFWWDPLKRTAE